jgi:putative ABC transport system substrate-binding protein
MMDHSARSPWAAYGQIAAGAGSLGVKAVAALVRDDPADIERAIVDFAREPDGGLILPPDVVTFRYRVLIAGLAIKYRLPTVSNNRAITEAGGLMIYAPAPLDYHLVAAYIDRILRGAKPADLPVETPSRFNLVINLKTAKALGLEVPASMQQVADEVIE